MNLVAAVAYHFCLALAAVFTQPGARLFAEAVQNPRIPRWKARGYGYIELEDRGRGTLMDYKPTNKEKQGKKSTDNWEKKINVSGEKEK